ncbi:hypothetical protein GJAV_G00191550 [Gymnothorax javanicus]|nr:hypothetical protein GJAV_G00191550 [Gymnothorax javanicus]
MGNRGVQSLCAGLEGSGVQILRLPRCKLTEEDCGYLAPVLCTSQLHLLDLSANDFEDAGLLKLCPSLSSPRCQLQEIGLKMCGFTGSSMEALSTALRCGNSVLRSLDLDRNPLGDTGADWISATLRDPHCNLQRLILYGCELTDACCAGLADAFRTTGRALTELDLSVNELGDQGVLQLIDAFKTANCFPKKLGLNRCEVGLQVFEELAEVLRLKESRLRELEVGVNEVGDAGAKHLVEMLGLTDECVPELCAAVRANGSLKSLVLKNNGLTDATVPALVAMAQASHTLRELNVQYNDYSEDVFELMDTCGKIRY